jgi:transposase
MMIKPRNKFSPEVLARAVQMVFDHETEYPSHWASMVSIATKIGCAPQSLNDWVKAADNDGGRKLSVTTDMAAQLKALEREK